jgi:hypothetical protein
MRDAGSGEQGFDAVSLICPLHPAFQCDEYSIEQRYPGPCPYKC